VIAAIFGVLFCLWQAGAMVSLVANRAGFSWIAPAMAVAAVGIGYILAGWEGLVGYRRLRPLAWSLALMALAVGLAAFYYDLSVDGQWYHQTAILSLAQGWSPVTEPLRPFTANLQLFVRHYAKGPWYAAAEIFAATGHIELGKAIDWIAFAAMFCAGLGATLDAGLGRRRAFTLAVVLALNPVVLSELTTFMVDEIVFAFLAVAAAATWTGLQFRARPALLVAGISGAIACINAKFTGLVFLCFVAAAAALWCLVYRREKFHRFVLVAAGTLLLGAGVWGYNPYVTNTLYRHQPFYPVLGSASYPSLTQQGKEGIELYETPKNMQGRNRLVRFGYAIFGRPGNQPYQKGRNASLMWPFDAHPRDLYAYTFHETRVAGFGPWFSGSLLLSLLLGLGLAATARLRWPLALVSGAIAASLLISPHLWWPRYGPQLWLLPIVPLVFAFGGARPRGQIWGAWILAGLLIVNAGIVGWMRFHWETAASLRLGRQLAAMRQSGLTYDVSSRYFHNSTDERLGEAGVKSREIGSKPPPHGTELTSVVDGYSMFTQYAPEAK
jgi:hypothetical protein